MTLQKVALAGLFAMSSGLGAMAERSPQIEAIVRRAGIEVADRSASRPVVEPTVRAEGGVDRGDGARPEAEAPRAEAGKPEPFGQWVSAQTHAGVHGRDLAAAIHAEKGKPVKSHRESRPEKDEKRGRAE